MIDSFTFETIAQIFAAAILGMAIGFERERKRKPAGLRTYSLVSVGSALFTILSIAGFSDFVGNTSYDPSRIASQVVVGIGFLGAGIIFFTKMEVRGLTTAAGIWVSAAIGMAVGLKFYALAVFTTVLSVLILWFVRSLEEKIGSKHSDDVS